MQTAPEIILKNLSPNLTEQSSKDFEKMFAMKPTERHKVQNKNKEVVMQRFQKSYMNTPLIKWFELDEKPNTYRTSYMFSGLDDTKNRENLPEIFQPYLAYVNETFPECHFNQVSINWYEDGEDFIPFHRDCQDFMKGNKNVVILTLNDIESGEIPRILELKLDRQFKSDEFFYLSDKYFIELKHGSMLVLTPEIQRFYRHGIRKMEGGKKRISLSFRQF